MMKKAGWLKNAIATTKGLFDEKGKKLKGANLSEEFVAAWNGIKEEVVEAAEKIEQKVEDALDVEINVFTEAKEEEAPKKKPTKKKKGFFSKK